MDIINPELRELRQKYEEVRTSLAKVEGEMRLLITTISGYTRQTIWQFMIFTVTMAAVFVGGVKYQADTLRHEMDIRFEAQRREMNARFDAMDKRIEFMEKRLESLEKQMVSMQKDLQDLKQEVRASRK